jgi:hypothetical protein
MVTLTRFFQCQLSFSFINQLNQVSQLNQQKSEGITARLFVR